jgi:hypothetical protein
VSITEMWNKLIKRDPVKAAIAGAVQRGIRAPYVPVIPAASEITDQDIIAQAVSPLETVIRVNAPRGKRYFRVKVSEML